MRTEKELWEVVLSRTDLFRYGLCFWLLEVWFKKNLNDEEYKMLDQIIDSSGLGYWIGPKGELKPRIDWINERIKQL